MRSRWHSPMQAISHWRYQKYQNQEKFFGKQIMFEAIENACTHDPWKFHDQIKDIYQWSKVAEKTERVKSILLYKNE